MDVLKEPDRLDLDELAAEQAERRGRSALDDWMGLAEILFDNGYPCEDNDIVYFADLIRCELNRAWG